MNNVAIGVWINSRSSCSWQVFCHDDIKTFFGLQTLILNWRKILCLNQ